MNDNDDINPSVTLEHINRLKSDMPEIWSEAEVVGNWVWLEFSTTPAKGVRDKLKELGFHWNGSRKCWQHPCGASRARSRRDPRAAYRVVAASDFRLGDTQRSRGVIAEEYKVVALRECPLPEQMQVCDTSQKAADYWRLHIETNPFFNRECECFAAMLLNARGRIRGHQLLTVGTMNTLLAHSREVFRGAIIAGAFAVVLMHNHPSGEPEPSDADLKVTRDLIRAGRLLEIEINDHVIVGNRRHCSLRDLGLFYS